MVELLLTVYARYWLEKTLNLTRSLIEFDASLENSSDGADGVARL
jgi:hypothetical protein